MRDHQARFPVAALCRVLQVSKSGYYAWAKRPQSARAQRDALLVPQIIASHERSDSTYGSPRILGDLRMQESLWAGSALHASCARLVLLVG